MQKKEEDEHSYEMYKKSILFKNLFPTRNVAVEQLIDISTDFFRYQKFHMLSPEVQQGQKQNESAIVIGFYVSSFPKDSNI